MLRKTFKKLKGKLYKNKSIIMLYLLIIPISAIWPIIAYFVCECIKESNFNALMIVLIFSIIAVRILVDIIINLIRDL